MKRLLNAAVLAAFMAGAVSFSGIVMEACAPRRAEAQAVQRGDSPSTRVQLRTQMFYTATPEERDLWRGPSFAIIGGGRVVAYRIGGAWFQAGVEQCIPGGSP